MTRNVNSAGLCRAALVSIAALLAGCAMHSMPAEEMGLARSAVNAAAGTRAEATPDLQRAQRKLVLAQRWIDAKDYGPARWLAEQAEVDAELARARTEADAAQMTLAQRERSLTAVRSIAERRL